MFTDLARTLRRDPHRPAFLGTGWDGQPAVRATLGEVADLADRFTRALHARGLRAGDTVGFAARGAVRPLAVTLAAARLGLRIAVLDPTAGPDVLLARLSLAAPSLVLADAAAQLVAGWARPLARRHNLALPDLARLAPVATVGPRLPGCARALSAGRGAVGATPDHTGEDGDAVVIFTSGTTSQPRAVVYTWAGMDAAMRGVADLVRPRAGQPVVGDMFFVVVPSLAAGAPVAAPARSPRSLARQLRRLRPQETYLTPPQLRGALAASARFTGRVWTGSAPASADLLGRVRRAGADEAWGVYAMTEMIPIAATEAREKAAFTDDGDLVGALMPGVQARIDPDGQLLLTGPARCDRYLGAPRPPWIATGDLARLDRGRSVTRVVLAGRRKDMILRRAENIYPGLYEPTLHVPGVDLAVLVGLPDAEGDERVVAVVQPSPGADPRAVHAALADPVRRMGSARPDAIVLAPVPLAGRSRKPDRRAAAALAARRLAAR
jgi:acyl-CoA synthetase (AMP-forming)/AMP-acid ligase II